jgi:hypothetical protein
MEEVLKYKVAQLLVNGYVIKIWVKGKGGNYQGTRYKQIYSI